MKLTWEVSDIVRGQHVCIKDAGENNDGHYIIAAIPYDPPMPEPSELLILTNIMTGECTGFMMKEAMALHLNEVKATPETMVL